MIKVEDHVLHLDQMFNIAQRYEMKLHPLKCIFGGRAGNCFGFVFYNRGIKANLKKIQPLLDKQSSKSLNVVQTLAGIVVALY